MRSVSLLIALLLALLTPGLTQAQDDATPLPPEVACAKGADAMYIKEIMPLMQAVPEDAYGKPSDTFFYNQLYMRIEEGAEVTIGGPAGQPYWTRDRMSLSALPRGLSWTHYFRSADGASLVPLQEPVSITYMFQPGALNVLTLRALSGPEPTQASSPYVLTIWNPCASLVASATTAQAVTWPRMALFWFVAPVTLLLGVVLGRRVWRGFQASRKPMQP